MRSGSAQNRKVHLATAVNSTTPVADKNLVASEPTNMSTGLHEAKMVTPRYTVVLLQFAIMLRSQEAPCEL